jgi:hypothetical protein
MPDSGAETSAFIDTSNDCIEPKPTAKTAAMA